MFKSAMNFSCESELGVCDPSQQLISIEIVSLSYPTITHTVSVYV